MRGSDKLKKILESNENTKKLIVQAVGTYNLVLLFIYFFYHRSIWSFAFLSLFEAASLAAIWKTSKAVVVKENGTDKLVSVASLNSPGLMAFAFDVLFWGMLCKLLVVFSWRWAILYLGMPVSFISEFVYKPYKKLKQM